MLPHCPTLWANPRFPERNEIDDSFSGRLTFNLRLTLMVNNLTHGSRAR